MTARVRLRERVFETDFRDRTLYVVEQFDTCTCPRCDDEHWMWIGQFWSREEAEATASLYARGLEYETVTA